MASNQNGSLTEALQAGYEVSFEKTISAADVRDFARISGDVNPLHLDDDIAAQTRFGKPIVHGILVAGVISAAIGTELAPIGTYPIYLEQSLHFKRPVFVDDVVCARCTISQRDPERCIATLDVTCTNQHEKVVLHGTAKIMLEELMPSTA